MKTQKRTTDTEGCGAGIINQPDRLPPPEKKRKKPHLSSSKFLNSLSFSSLFSFFISSPTYLVADRSQGRFQDMHPP
jgi:hypothetical protein